MNSCFRSNNQFRAVSLNVSLNFLLNVLKLILARNANSFTSNTLRQCINTKSLNSKSFPNIGQKKHANSF